METKMLASGLRSLSSIEFERKLLEWNLFDPIAMNWKRHLYETGVFFDLSAIEHVELPCLVQLVILIEGLLRSGVPTVLALPHATASLLEGDSPHRFDAKEAQRSWKALNRRVAAAQLLDRLGFPFILQEPAHVKAYPAQLQIHVAGDKATPDFFDKVPIELPQPGFVEVMPLTWLPRHGEAAEGPSYREIAHELWQIIVAVAGSAVQRPGVLSEDTLANVLFPELVGNTLQHSSNQCTYALVAARVFSKVPAPRMDEVLSCEREFFEWAHQAEAPLLDLIVSDSGPGVVETLLDQYRRRLPSDREDLYNDYARVIDFAFDRWSTRSDGDLANAHPSSVFRGLYKVNRVIRRHDGLITIRSNDQWAGRDHGGAGFDIRVKSNEQLAFLPGCVHRVRIPLSPNQRPKWRSAPLNNQQSSGIEVVALEPLTEDGLTGADQQKLYQTFDAPSDPSAPTVLAVFAPDVRDPISSNAVLLAMIQAYLLQENRRLVLLGLPGGREFVSGIIGDFNDRIRKADRSPYSFDHSDKIALAIGGECEFGWLGVDKFASRTLQMMLLRQDPDRTRERDGDRQSLHRNAQFERLLRTSEWFHTDKSDDKNLRFSFDDVIAQIDQSLRHRIDAKRASASADVYYRAPSLVLLSTFFTLWDLCPTAHDLILTAFALSIRMRQDSRLESILSEANTILCDAQLPQAASREIVRFFGSNHAVERTSSEVEDPPGPTSNEIDSGAKVIIFCDILFSGETASRFAKQALRDGAEPLVITCFVDGRRESTDAIQVYGTEIPIVCISRHPVVLENDPPNARAIDINPISLGVEAQPKSVADSAGIRGELIQVLQETHALYFRHIGKPLDRHFTLFIDPRPLLEDSRVRASYRESIRAWLSTLSAKGHPLAYDLYYPSHSSHSAVEDLVSWLAEELPRPTVIPVRRRLQDLEYAFPPDLPNEPRENIAIVDWGAMTGTTIKRMVRLAAERGARNILFCVYISQMPKEDYEFFQSFRGMEIEPGREIDVTIRFAHRFEFGFYAAHDCPVCHQLAQLKERKYPTEYLNKFKAERRKELELVERDELQARKHRSIDCRPLPEEAFTWMARWRNLLDSARTSTTIRSRLLDSVRNFDATVKSASVAIPSEVCWLMHFFSLESQWLRQPPLHFDSISTVLACIAHAIAVRRSADDYSRLDAINVLRMTDKKKFAESVHEIFSRVHDKETLVAHLLHNIYTYLSRPYHQHAVLLKPLADSLEVIEKDLQKGLFVIPVSARETALRLYRMARRNLSEAEIQDMDLVDVWKSLIRRYDEEFQGLDAHFVTERKMLRIKGGDYREEIEKIIKRVDRGSFPEAIPPPIDRYFKTLKDEWETCRRFLDEDLLPHLRRLREILESYDGQHGIGHKATRRLTPYINSTDTISETRFARIIERLSADPMKALNAVDWDFFTRESDWFYETLFDIKRDSERKAKLYQFLQTVPSHPYRAIRREYLRFKDLLGDKPTVKGLKKLKDDGFKVFCTEGVLRYIFGHLFENIRKHRGKGGPTNVKFNCFDEGKFILIVMMNDGTSTTATEARREGFGHWSIMGRLRAFGGHIEANTNRGREWGATYSVDLRLRKWEI